MHRSGTSLLTGLLCNAGFYLGRSVSELSYDNPRGFNENYRIQEFNDRLLTRLGSSWDAPKHLSQKWLSENDWKKELQEARKILNEEFTKEDKVVIKDPRISILLPFWKPIFGSYFRDVKYILALRHPDEIASSLYQRNLFETFKSYDLTFLYWESILKSTPNKDMVTIGFEELFSNVIGVFDKLVELGVDVNNSEIEASIDPKLRHYTSQADQESDHFVQQLYRQLKYGHKHYSSDQYIYEKQKALNRIANADEQVQVSQLAKLFYDTGNGYNESESMIQIHNGEQLDWKCRVERSEKIYRILIQPIHKNCTIQLDQFKVEAEGLDSSGYEISENALNREDRNFYFDQDFPRFIINFKEPVSYVGLHLKCKFLPYRHSKDEKNVGSNWSIAILMTIKYPIRFLRQINFNNYKILRSALKRESPARIVKNFIKLLQRPEHQKSLERRSKRNREDFFEGDLSPSNGEEKFLLKHHIFTEKRLRILYVTDVLPTYDKSSGGKRATNYLKLLSSAHSITIAYTQQIEKKYSDHFHKVGISCIKLSQIEELGIKSFDVIILAWFYLYDDLLPFISSFKDRYLILDTVDVHWVREERALHSGHFSNRKQVEANKKKGIQIYKEADILWAVSVEDQQAIMNEIPNAIVEIIPNVHENITTDYLRSQKNNLLFFGGYSHHPNVEAVKLLVTVILPKVLKKIPDANVIIAGSDASVEVLDLADHPNVKFLGYIEEADIPMLYQNTRLCVAPLFSGAGMKGKITEAINYMCPVVTTSIGNEGIGLENAESALIADTEEELASCIIEALENKYDLERMTMEAKAILSNRLDLAKTTATLQRTMIRVVIICIVTWNRKSLLQACIESILENTKYPNYQILVHSNGCTDGTSDYLEKLTRSNHNITSYFAKGNEGFVLPNNQLMSSKRKGDIVLLNNDTTVTPGWLTKLNQQAYQKEKIGIVGPKILYPDNTLQEFGSKLYNDGTGINMGKNDNPNDPAYNKSAFVPYVSGCAMYIKRKVLEDVGLFDETYHPCYYEDSDLCYRVWQYGYQVVVTPHSIIYHKEGGTAGTNIDSGMKSKQEVNRYKFVAKHGKRIEQINKKVKKVNKFFTS